MELEFLKKLSLGQPRELHSAETLLLGVFSNLAGPASASFTETHVNGKAFSS